MLKSNSNGGFRDDDRVPNSFNRLDSSSSVSPPTASSDPLPKGEKLHSVIDVPGRKCLHSSRSQSNRSVCSIIALIVFFLSLVIFVWMGMFLTITKRMKLL